METELSFGQTTFLLWVPPFLSYELWKLKIEISNLVGQTVSQVAVVKFFFFWLGRQRIYNRLAIKSISSGFSIFLYCLNNKQ